MKKNFSFTCAVHRSRELVAPLPQRRVVNGPEERRTTISSGSHALVACMNNKEI